MTLWKNWSVISRLYVVFTAIGAVIAALMALGYTDHLRTQKTINSIVDTEYERMRTVSDWQLHASGTTDRIIAINRSNDPALAALFGPEIRPRIEVIDKYFSDIKQWAIEPEQMAAIKAIEDTGKLLEVSLNDIAKARAEGDQATALSIFETRFMPLANTAHKGVEQFAKLQAQQLKKSIRSEQEEQWKLFWLSNAVVALIVALGTALIAGLTRNIRRSLDEAIQTAEAVATGDLRTRSRKHNGDEFGTLMRTLDSMTDSLGSVVRHVRQSTDHISDASREIAHGNQDLSERTERQASHLQQTAANMEQLTNAVRATADNASEASRLAAQAREVAHRGGDVVGRVVDTMGEIENSSRRIEEIISVIDGISFQTNILALNAAVEAARAGEQGRGFAVVAAEVRSLAQRSAGAAKEIKALINDSSAKVRDGGVQVASAGKTMHELVDSVSQVSALINEISQSTSEQRKGIADVGDSVAEIDRSTQQNAALVEEAAAAAGSLKDQAIQLDEAVRAFQI